MGLMDDERYRRAQRLAFLRSAGIPDVFIPTPPPAQATPATPLPGAMLEVPVIAPQSEEAVAVRMQPQAQAFDELAPVRALLQNAPRQYAPTGVKAIDDRLAQTAATGNAGAQNYMNLIAGAQVDPRVLAILEARRARAEKDEAELEADQKKSGWDALMRAGLEMAKSNSPYFMQALATGIDAGVRGLDEDKLKADEKRARLQAAKEDTVLAEIQAKQTAQDRIAATYNAALAAGKSETEAREAAIRSAVTVQTLPQQLRLADLEVEKAEADVGYTKASTARALREPSGGGSGGDGTGTGRGRRLTENARAEYESRLVTASSEQEEAFREWVDKGRPLLGQVKPGTSEWKAASKYEAARNKVNGILGILGQKKLGAAPVRAGDVTTQSGRVLGRQGGPRPAAAARPAKPAAGKSPKPKDYPDAKQGVDGEWYVVRNGKTYKVEG